MPLLKRLLALLAGWLLVLRGLAMAGAGHALWQVFGASTIRVGLLQAAALVIAGDALLVGLLVAGGGEGSRIVIGYFAVAGPFLGLGAYGAIRHAWQAGMRRMGRLAPPRVPCRLLVWAALGVVLAPDRALAHGEEALFLGLMLPVSVVPAVFLISVWFWRSDWTTKALTGALLALLGAALVGVSALLSDTFADRLLSAPGALGVVLWFGPPIVVQGAAWALFARWRGRRSRSRSA